MQLVKMIDSHFQSCGACIQSFTLISSLRSPGRAACGRRIS